MCLFSEERHDADSKTETIGNDTLEGQIASFMDSLNMSYKEVMSLPYARLIVMQKDKLRPLTGKRVVKMSGRDMMKMRNKNK